MKLLSDQSEQVAEALGADDPAGQRFAVVWVDPAAPEGFYYTFYGTHPEAARRAEVFPPPEYERMVYENRVKHQDGCPDTGLNLTAMCPCPVAWLPVS